MDKYTIEDFGGECFSGWDGLIQPILDYVNEYNDGIVDDEHCIHIEQIKEKFGLLHIYVSKSDDRLDQMIKDAMHKSATVCEICGEEGELKSVNGWLSVRCDKHRRKEHED